MKLVRSFNSDDELREELKFLSNPDSWNLLDVLNRANRRVASRVGRVVNERLKFDFEGQKEFDLSFRDVLEVKKVFLNNEVVSDDDYDVVDGVVVFSDGFAGSLNVRSRLNVVYVPMIFKDLELHYAVVEVLSRAVVQLNDEEQNVRLNQAKSFVNALLRDISRGMPVVDRSFDKGLRRRYSYL